MPFVNLGRTPYLEPITTHAFELNRANRGNNTLRKWYSARPSRTWRLPRGESRGRACSVPLPLSRGRRDGRGLHIVELELFAHVDKDILQPPFKKLESTLI